MTSFRCVNHIKHILKPIVGKFKIGHAGTLDPFATGLLIVCVGREATRNIDRLLTMDKVYLVKAKLGEHTDTLYHTCTLQETFDATHISQEYIEQAIQSFGH